MNAKTFFKCAASLVLAGAAALSMTVFVGADGAATTATTTPTAANMYGKAIVMDGKRDSSEGWTSTPTQSWSTSDFKCETYIGTDGSYLYYFIEVNNIANDNYHSPFVQIDFDNTDATYEGNYTDYLNDSANLLGEKSIFLPWVSDNSYTTYHAYRVGTQKAGDPANGSGESKYVYTEAKRNIDHCAVKDTTNKKLSLEFRVLLPDSLKSALKNGSYTIGSETAKWTGWLATPVADTGVLDSSNSYILPEKCHDVILPQIAVTTPIVANMYGKTVSMNGTRDLSDGWTASPTFVVNDQMKASPVNVWLGSDGEYIYGHIEASASQHKLFQVQIDFVNTYVDGGDKVAYRNQLVNASTSKNNAASVSFISLQSSKWPYNQAAHLLGASYFSDAGWTGSGDDFSVLADANPTVFEFRVKLKASVAEALKNGTVTIAADVISLDSGWNPLQYTNGIISDATNDKGEKHNRIEPAFCRDVTLPSTNVELIGMQMGEMDGKGAVRFVSALYQTVDFTAYSEIGFNLTLNGKTVSKNCTEVYNAISANYGAAQVTAASQGAKYLYAITLTGLEYDKEYVLTVQPWAKTTDGKTVTGVAYTTSVVVAAPGQSAQGASISANNDPVACNLANELAASQGWTVSKKKQPADLA